jgi:hypothetical protein
MKIELSKQEIKLITYWYWAASGESVSHPENPAFLPLLKKLGLKPTSQDLYELKQIENDGKVAA